jgi:MFS family permease
MSMLCLFFTAITNANIGIISQFASQNDNDWIGPLSISLIFLGSGLGVLYSKYIHKYPFSKVIFVGTLGWNIFISFSVMFLFIGFENYIVAVIAIGSLVCGIVMSLYYNGTFNYVNDCGWRDGVTEMYFAINMCFNQSSNIVGNLLSAFLIEPLGQKTYSFVMLGLAVAISLCFLFTK